MKKNKKGGRINRRGIPKPQTDSPRQNQQKRKEQRRRRRRRTKGIDKMEVTKTPCFPAFPETWSSDPRDRTGRSWCSGPSSLHTCKCKMECRRGRIATREALRSSGGDEAVCMSRSRPCHNGALFLPAMAQKHLSSCLATSSPTRQSWMRLSQRPTAAAPTRSPPASQNASTKSTPLFPGGRPDSSQATAHPSRRSHQRSMQ